MKVVFIGNDTSILTGSNSDSWNRQKKYSQQFESLKIIIFALKKNRLHERRWKNLVVIPTNSSNRWSYLSDSLKILSKIRPFNLVSCQDPFLAGLVGVLAKIFLGIKLNIQIHNDFFQTSYFKRENLQNFIFYFLGKITLVFADSVRVVSKRFKMHRKDFIAPVPTDLNFFWSKYSRKRSWQVITIARLSRQKNLSLFLDVAKKLKSKFPKIYFIIVGEGEERKYIEKLIRDNKQNSYVELFGQANHREVKRLLRGSDLFLLTSNYEGWGLVVLEAMAVGVPIVMSDVGCANEVVINHQTGRVIKVGDKDKFVTAVSQLITDRKLAGKYVHNGKKLLENEFSRRVLIKQFVEGLKNTK